MSKQNDGGPAFPKPTTLVTANEPWQPWNEEQPGMSLRDYFAAQALNGFLSGRVTFVDNNNPNENNFAIAAYKVADAMIAERIKERP